MEKWVLALAGGASFLSEILLSLLLPVVTTIVGKFFLDKVSKKEQAVLQKLSDEREEINQQIGDKKEFDIFDTIRLNLNQLNEYYAINKTQAKSSFLFSLFAIVVGLITIVIGIGIQYYGKNPDVNTTVLTSVSGLLLEFIGGAYFFIYKKSLEQVNFFFGQLVKIQDTMLAINLTKGIESTEKQVELIEKIVMSLLERSLK